MTSSPLDDYIKLRPVRFPHLLDFSLRRRLEKFDPAGVLLHLAFCDLNIPLGGETSLLLCQFEDISNLKMTIGSEVATGPLDIEDLRAHQLELIKFRVQDYDHEHLQFECRDFTCRISTLREYLAARGQGDMVQ